jgi:hypothetical protein
MRCTGSKTGAKGSYEPVLMSEFPLVIDRPLALGSHIRASAIAVLALGLHHTPLVLASSSFSFYWSHISSLYGSSYGSSLISYSYHHNCSYHHSCSYHRPPSDNRTHAARNQDAPRGHGHNTQNTVHTNCDALQLQLLFTGTSTWTQQRLTDSTPTTTERATLHTLDFLIHLTLPEMNLTRLPAPHLGTTSPINDHPPPPSCRRQLPAILTTSFAQRRSPATSLMTACSSHPPGRSADRRSPAPRR